MGNSTPGVVTKILTLVPFVVALYFFDFTKFTVIFTPSLLAFFVASLTIFVIGVILKTKILRAALQLSSASFGWGALLLAFFVAAYLYGAYSPDVAWYRYESLFLLVFSYVAFRIGTRVLKVMSPLLLILAFSFAPLGLFPAAAGPWVSAGVFCIYVVAFLAYAKLRLQSVLLPTLVAEIGLAVWLLNRLQPALPFYLYALLPVPILVLLMPKARAFILLPSAKPAGKCPGLDTQADGFCSTCGVRLSAPRTKENIGPWGLLALAGVTALLLSASVPALALVGGVPSDVRYSPQGFSSSAIPATPSGWQVNSTTVQKFPFDLYAVVKVYVPLVHPETKNYTVYYEVAAGLPVSNIPNGGEVTGWNRVSNDFMLYGPYHGYLTTYTTSGRVMLSYKGTTLMLFVEDGTFQEYYVGLGFLRVFNNSNVTADSSQFLGDINTVWLPLVSTDVSSSTWTGFLSSTYDGLVFVRPLLLLVASISVMSWFSVQALRRDERLDRFLTLSSVQSQSSWSTLSLLLARKNHAGTPLDLANDEMGAQSRDSEGTGVSLSRPVRRSPSLATGRDLLLSSGHSPSDGLVELEQRHLVRRVLVEDGSDVISTWQLIA
jgi:hypothetical protein